MYSQKTTDSLYSFANDSTYPTLEDRSVCDVFEDVVRNDHPGHTLVIGVMAKTDIDLLVEPTRVCDYERCG